MIVLILLGLISLTIVIERIIFFVRYRLWDKGQIEKYLQKASKTSNARYGEDMEDYLRKVFQLYANKLERGLSLLSGIGQISPIVGFLGTVLGMINAFAAIAAATTVNAKVVAVGIQVALVTTAGGLLVAAPSLTFYYLFMHLIQNRYAQSEEEIGRLCMGLPKLSETLHAEQSPSS
ncbi:MAG: MotA/TolQ/ExbB proton channel family protein [bacterium]